MIILQDRVQPFLLVEDQKIDVIFQSSKGDKQRVRESLPQRKIRAMLAVTGDGFNPPKPFEQDQSFADELAIPRA